MYFKLTKETQRWFDPIISEKMKCSLRDDPNVFGIGAVKDKKACGVLVFRLNEDKAEIIYIAVSDNERRKGVGTGMINYLCEHAYRSTTMVGCSFLAEDKTDSLYLFFAAQNAFTTTEDEGFVCRVTVQELRNAKLPNKNEHLEKKQIFSLPVHEQKKFIADIRAKGFFLSSKDDYVKPLCLCSVDKIGVDAAVFIERGGDDSLVLSFVYCAREGSSRLVSLLAEVSNRITSKMDEKASIYIAAVTPQSMAIVDKLLPSYTVTGRFFRADWDMGE